MSKKYMDFMPIGAEKKASEKKAVAKSAPAMVAASKPVASKVAAAKSAPAKGTVVKPVAAKSTAVKDAAKVAKKATGVSELEISKMFEARAEKPKAGVSRGSVKSTKNDAAADYRQKFVKTTVEKRPLSKNVYQKKLQALKELDATPENNTSTVTIINKPEKESRVGLVVTVIITIILGAAAGVVSFLLLPK